MAALTVQGGGVSLLTTVGTVSPGTGLLADGGSEDNLDFLDFLGEVQPCRERTWVLDRATYNPDRQALRMRGTSYIEHLLRPGHPDAPLHALCTLTSPAARGVTQSYTGNSLVSN